MQNALVTAVIPTRNRPELLQRAIASVRAQTYSPIEIVVVIDGPDNATRALLSAMPGECLRFIPLQKSVGGSDARNIGVQNATSEWIAFLDDDDEWLPTKIEKQLASAAQASEPYPVVSSQLIAKSPYGNFVWPRRFPAKSSHQRISVQSKNLFRGEGQLQTSMILARRSLLQLVPFTSGLRKHQDLDGFARRASAGRAIPFRSRTAGELLPRGKSRRDHQPSGLAVFSKLAHSQSRTDDSQGVCWIHFHALGARSLAARRLAGAAATLRRNVSPRKARLHGSSLFLGMWLIRPDFRRTLRGLRHSNAIKQPV